MKHKISLHWPVVLAAVCLAAVSGGAEESLAVLDGTLDGAPAGDMMKRYLNAEAQPSFAQRHERYEALKTPEDITAYQQQLHAQFVEHLGGFPERTPLNPQVVGGETLEDYKYEKVIYESRPGYYVTGTLYLPLSPPPYPGVIVPCGHEAEGKAGETYQRAAILLAKNGIAALCYDPYGQGERFYFFKDTGEPAYSSTVHHTLFGAGAILLGTNTAAFRIWDGMRSLDYLESRPEIDKTKLGCTGNSGGGTLTSYMMALDPRVYCAAPSCYITSFPRLLATIGPQDAEQTIHGQIAFGLDHADYLILRAPRPTLILSNTRDFFDITGTWDSFREAKRVYTRLGVPERAAISELDDEHGYWQTSREAMVRWMSRWLLNKDLQIEEQDFPVHTAQELWCTPNGKVMELPGAKSPYDFSAELESGCAAKRAEIWQRQPLSERLQRVRELAGIGALDNVAAPAAESHGRIAREAYSIEKLLLRPEPGIALPALFFSPGPRPATTVLYVHGDSKEADAGSDGPIEQLLGEGKAVLSIDLRGVGETAAPVVYGGEWLLVGPDWPDVSRAYLLGRTVAGMRAEDILRCAEYARQRGAMNVEIVAVGETTVPALQAAALAPDKIARVTLRGGIPSWSEVVKTPRAKEQWINTVHGALQYYDLPDLAALLGDKITQSEMTVPQF